MDDNQSLLVNTRVVDCILKFKKLHKDAVIPQYQTKGSAGFDFHLVEDVIIKPGETKLLKLGLACEITEGFELQIRPRSGISVKTDLVIKNSPATIDSDYRGEIAIIAKNNAYLSIENEGEILYPASITFSKGDRIAQGVISKLPYVHIEEVTELSETVRGSGGLGSTGV